MKVFITGVSSGIGKETVKILLDQGHEVWGVSRKGVSENNQKFRHSTCDVSDPRQVKQTLQEMDQANFSPDIVILNAGIVKPDTLGNFSYSVGREVFDVNYDGAMLWVDGFLRFPRRPSQFIAVSSIFAFRPDHEGVSYSASKSALSMAFRSLNLKFAKSGTIFKVIYFGPIDTLINPIYKKKNKSIFIVTPKAAGRKIVSVLKSNSSIHYFPFLLTLMIRLGGFLSDKWFAKITNPFRR